MNENIRDKVNKVLLNKSVDGRLTDFVYYYYDHYIAHFGEEDFEVDYDHEVYLPLEARASGILEAMRMLLENGSKANDESDGECPLMIAVAWGDFHMVKFLLDNGADPKKWPEMNEKSEIIQNNWYLEDIDVHYMNECWANDCDENYLKGLQETARVLIKRGGLRNFYGHSLVVNDDGTGEIGAAKLMY